MLEWNVQRGWWIDENEGIETESLEELGPEFRETIANAGPSKFKASGPIVGVTQHEYLLLRPTSPNLKVMGLRTLRSGISSTYFSAKTRKVGMILTT